MKWRLADAQRLAGAPGLTLNDPGPAVHSSYWMTTVLVDPALGLDKLELMRRLAVAGIDSRPFFYPLSALPAFRAGLAHAAARARNRVAYELSDRGVNLPSALVLDEGQVARVCDALLDIVSTGRGQAAAVA